MAIQPYQEQSPYPTQEEMPPPIGADLEVVRSHPAKRLRWATVKMGNHSQAKKKRQSILNRFHKRDQSEATVDSGGSTADGNDGDETAGMEDTTGGRTVYFNLALPASARDEEGRPTAHYPRNKIRTAKYTPLSFIPKNLWFQFHNVANVYFLFIIILQVCLFVLSFLPF